MLLGIGAIIGTGIFVLTGTAAANHAGPALVVSFLIAGLDCALAGLCYAEFASMIPVSGSAYSYSYATLGEGVAWFIGWNPILGYLFAAATVAVGWSGYVVSLVEQLGFHLPDALTNAPLTKGAGHFEIVRTGTLLNLPAVLVVAAITALCYVGIHQSARFNAIVVVIKVTVILVMMLGQPRIFYAMSQDGLLPPLFRRVHPTHKTPYVGTLITGSLTALIAGLFPVTILGELVSIGTLLAFTTVCIGVLVLRYTQPDIARHFKVPAPWLVCISAALVCTGMMLSLPHDTWLRLLGWTIIGFAIYAFYGFRHSELRKGGR